LTARRKRKEVRCVCPTALALKIASKVWHQVVVDRAARAAEGSLFIHFKETIMKSSIKLSLALVSILAVSSVALAQGRGAPAGAGAQGAAASTAGTQSRLHTPGTGLTTGTTPLQTRIHAPGTGLGTAAPGSAQGRPANGGRGIHTPGTGLTTTAPVVVPVVVPVVN
jgi:hypothetical protein